jgi:hypothetical protein
MRHNRTDEFTAGTQRETKLETLCRLLVVDFFFFSTPSASLR